MSSMSGPNWLGASWRAGTTMLRAFWKLARQLFHEATGTLFALFAVYAGTACWKQLRQPGNQWIAALAAAYAGVMAFFSISSFRSARRVR
jgi:hypothetical protein